MLGRRLGSVVLGLLVAAGCLAASPGDEALVWGLALEVPFGLGILMAAETRGKLAGSPLAAAGERRIRVGLLASHLLAGLVGAWIVGSPIPLLGAALLLPPRLWAIEGGWAARRGLLMVVQAPVAVSLATGWGAARVAAVHLSLLSISDGLGAMATARRD